MREFTDDCYLSLIDAARYLGRSSRWLQYKLNGPNPPPAYKPGKSWVFKKSDLDRWIEQFRAAVDMQSSSAGQAREADQCN
jgi:excisionase family DNA binding protein